MSIALTILTSGAVASVVGVVVSTWMESRKHRRDTRLEALNIAIALEGYAMECAKRISDHEIAVQSDGHAGGYMGGVPEFPSLNVSVGFLRPKRAAVANELLAFPQEIQQAEQDAEFWWGVVGDPECARNAATVAAATLALKSMSLAGRLRAAFRLPDRDLVFGDYDVSRHLEQALETHKSE